jgi:uncharacterized membrane protein
LTVVGTVNGTKGGFIVDDLAWKWTQVGGVAAVSSAAECAGALGVNSDGTVIVGYSGIYCESSPATVWTNGEPAALPYGGFDDSGATAVSSNGSVVVGFASSGTPVPVRWVSGGDPSELSSAYSRATGVSSDGSVAVGYLDLGGGSSPFKWTQAGGAQALSMAGYSSGTARGISGNGSIVVGSVGNFAVRWNAAGTALTLSASGGSTTNGVAYAASQDGSVIAGTTSASPSEAFVWTLAGGTRLLQSLISTVPTGKAMTATSISTNGKIVAGYGVADTSGTVKGWIAVLP